MATTPLFSASVDVIRSKLRLSGVPTTGDAESIIDDAVLEVRSGFVRELGAARVTALQAIAFTENPSTSDEVLRATANQTEVKWVKLVLMRSLPMRFLDGNADETQAYFDEALFRHMSAEQIDAERVRLNNEIQTNLCLLQGTTDCAASGGVQVLTLEPDTQPLPGATIFGGGQLNNHFI